MRVSWALWLSPVVFALGSFACVGDETKPDTTQGAEGGRCFPNQTCNDGLRCVSDRCVDSDGATSSSGAAGGSSSSGASVPCGAAPPVIARRFIACGDANCSLDAQQRCCASADAEQSVCTALGVQCEADQHDWQCTHYDHCYEGASYCCLTPVELSNTCPATAKSGGTRCAARCEGPELSLCQTDEHCTDGKHCKYLDIVGPDRRAVGACL